MNSRMARLWRRKRPQQLDAGGVGTPPPAAPETSPDPDLALPAPGPEPAVAPEQPVLLTVSGAVKPVHVGEVLLARRPRWPLALVRLPSVPKRAILAAGVCAGLAAPGIARHLAARMLLGHGAAPVGPVLEVTRIVYSGPLTPQAAAAIGKALAGGRR